MRLILPAELPGGVDKEIWTKLDASARRNLIKLEVLGGKVYTELQMHGLLNIGLTTLDGACQLDTVEGTDANGTRRDEESNGITRPSGATGANAGGGEGNNGGDVDGEEQHQYVFN